MGTEATGEIRVTAAIENLADLALAQGGFPPAERVRRVEVRDAVVDLGTTILWMPSRLIQELGLRPVRTLRARTGTGVRSVAIHDAVRLTIQDRDWPTEVAELPEAGPIRVGRVLLHALDLVVDPEGRCLIGNPDHGGEPMVEFYGDACPPEAADPPR